MRTNYEIKYKPRTKKKKRWAARWPSLQGKKKNESENSINCKLPLGWRFLYNLLLQVHECGTLVCKQSSKIDYGEFIKTSNCKISLHQIIPACATTSLSLQYTQLFSIAKILYLWGQDYIRRVGADQSYSHHRTVVSSSNTSRFILEHYTLGWLPIQLQRV